MRGLKSKGFRIKRYKPLRGHRRRRIIKHFFNRIHLSSRMLEYQELQKILPQAYPFVLIDRVLEYKEGESLLAIKNVTGSEWCMEGRTAELNHFPETLLIEAAAQAALVLYHVTKVGNARFQPQYFIGKTKTDFLSRVYPSQQIVINISSGKFMDSGGYADAQITADALTVAVMQLFFKVQKE